MARLAVSFSIDPYRDSRWIVDCLARVSLLIGGARVDETYVPLFNPTTGAPAKPVRLLFGTFFIKQRLGFTNEETVEQIRENAFMQFFLGFTGYSSKALFDPSMMVHFRKVQLSRRVAILRGGS